ncbi:MAG: hypothetical protein ACUVXB_00870 [Bryobacteraceae bacterium]
MTATTSLIANLSRTIGSSQQVRPYWFFGAGPELPHSRRGTIYGGRIIGGGFGVEAYVSKNVYLAPEVRVGGEPTFRFGIGVGHTFGCR